MEITAILIIVAIILGIITSLEDIKVRKIKNKWTFTAFGLGIMLRSVQFFTDQISGKEFSQVGVHLAVIGSIAIGGWYLRLWTAGDAKLMIAFTPFLPLWTGTPLHFLVNTFIPSIIPLFFLLIKYPPKQLGSRIFQSWKYLFTPKNLLQTASYLLVLEWLFLYLTTQYNFNHPYIVIMVILGLTQFLQEKGFTAVAPLLGIVAVMRLVLDTSVYTKEGVTGFAILLLVWGLYQGIIRIALGSELFAQRIPSNELKEGMILDEDFIQVTKKEAENWKSRKNVSCHIHKLGKTYIIQVPRRWLPREGFIEEEAEGISKSNIPIIQKIAKTVTIQKTIPFAPCLFAGALITILLEQNIIQFLL